MTAAAELDRIAAQIRADAGRIDRAIAYLRNRNQLAGADAITRLRDECACRQAKIDALMLEYCPDEMTPAQIAEWGRNQKRAPPEAEAALVAALAGDAGG